MIFAVTTVSAGVVASFLPLAAGVSAGVAALGLFAQAVTATASRWWAGRRGDRHGHARLLIPGLLLAAAGMTSLVWVPAPAVVIAGMCLFGTGFGIAQNATFALLIDRAPASGYGTASALWNLAYDAGYGAGPIVFGVFVAHTGYPAAFALTGLLILIALVPAVRDRAAVIEGWDDPNVAAFMHVRDVRYGLPNPVIQTIYPSGPLPAQCPPGMVALGSYGSCDAWQGELELDVLTVHLIAPYAKIVISATPADSEITDDPASNVAPPEMMHALEYISAHHIANAISISDGTGEDTYAFGTPGRPTRTGWPGSPAHGCVRCRTSRWTPSRARPSRRPWWPGCSRWRPS